MSSIQVAIELIDKVTAPVRNMMGAIDGIKRSLSGVERIGNDAEKALSQSVNPISNMTNAVNGFKQSFSGIVSPVSDVTNSFGGVGQSIAGTVSYIGNASNSIVGATNTISNAGTAISSAGSAVGTVGEGFSRSVIGINSAGSAVNGLNQAMANTIQPTVTLGGSAVGAGKSFTKLSDAEKTATASTQKIIDKMNTAKASMRGVESSVNSAKNSLVLTKNATQSTEKAIDGLRGSTDKLNSSFSSLWKIAGWFIFGSLAKQAINYASDLQEVQNVVDVSFGNMARRVDEWAKTTVNAVGLNELSAKRYASTLGAMMKSSGLAGDAVADMSMKLAELAGDMASFYNLTGDIAFDKIRSGLSGETEPLKQLGIDMSVTALDAYALASGIGKLTKDMTNAEKVQLRYNYLMSVTKDAHGDFSRTSDSYANQMKLLTENTKMFAGEIASNFLPMVACGVKWLNEMAQGAYGVYKFIKEYWSFIAPTIYAIATALGIYGAYLAFCKGMLAITAVYQWMLNSAMLASPIFWMVAGIVAVIGAIGALGAYMSWLGDTTHTVVGNIVGVFAMAGQLIWNIWVGTIDSIIQFLWSGLVLPWIGIVEWVLNVFRGGFNSFGDAVRNLLGNIISWFMSLGKVVTTIIDAIFGTDWTGGLSSLTTSLQSWGKNDKAITLTRKAPTLASFGAKRGSYAGAFERGAKMGDKWFGTASNAVTNAMNPEQKAIEQAKLNNQKGMLNHAKKGNDLAKKGNAGLKDLKNSIDISKENIVYLRDIAEREAINKFTTAEVKVDTTMTNNIGSKLDAKSIIETLATGLRDAMISSAQGI